MVIEPGVLAAEPVLDGLVDQGGALGVGREQVHATVGEMFKQDVNVPADGVMGLPLEADQQTDGVGQGGDFPWGFEVHVLVEDFVKLENFINEELYSLEGITRVESHILLRRFKSRTGLKL